MRKSCRKNRLYYQVYIKSSKIGWKNYDNRTFFKLLVLQLSQLFQEPMLLNVISTLLQLKAEKIYERLVYNKIN